MKVSIIIPAYNEAKQIGELIVYLMQFGYGTLEEIFVCDGGSSDNTMNIARKAGAKAVLCPEKGRAAQMNFGASLAKGDLLYFVHADTRPPESYIADLTHALNNGYLMGRYLSEYDSSSWLLKLNALASRLDTFSGMGGDQTLFITKTLFRTAGGFDGNLKIMEEFEFCARARKLGRYKIIPKPVLISARKYNDNGWLRVQRANYNIMRMYLKGASQESMVKRYRELLDYR